MVRLKGLVAMVKVQVRVWIKRYAYESPHKGGNTACKILFNVLYFKG